jgi:hypothetical protein
VRASGLTVPQIERAYSDFTRKHRAAAYLRTEPISLALDERGLAAAAGATLTRNA